MIKPLVIYLFPRLRPQSFCIPFTNLTATVLEAQFGVIFPFLLGGVNSAFRTMPKAPSPRVSMNLRQAYSTSYLSQGSSGSPSVAGGGGAVS